MARWLTGKNECFNGLTSVYKIYCHIIFPVCHCRILYTPAHTFKCRRRCRLHILPLTFRKTTPPNIISRNWTVFILRMPLRLRRFISQELIYEHKMSRSLSVSRNSSSLRIIQRFMWLWATTESYLLQFQIH